MITVVGEALVDLVRPATGTPVAHPGGSPANVAVGLARLGAPVALITRFGRDPYGDLLASHLTGNGVTARGEWRSAAPTSVAEAVLDETGAATYDFRITWDLAPALDQPADGSLCLHTGSIATALEPGASAVRRLVERAAETETVSYDPNCRPSLMGDPVAARRGVETLVAEADVVKVSDEDLAWLHPGRPHDDVAADWLALGPAVVVVTRGSGGCYGVCGSGAVERPRVPVEVVDTVGAGDAFTAGLLDALWRRHLLGRRHADRLRAVNGATMAELLEEAALVAAITCSRPGADPPTAEEVAAFGRQA